MSSYGGNSSREWPLTSVIPPPHLAPNTPANTSPRGLAACVVSNNSEKHIKSNHIRGVHKHVGRKGLTPLNRDFSLTGASNLPGTSNDVRKDEGSDSEEDLEQQERDIKRAAELYEQRREAYSAAEPFTSDDFLHRNCDFEPTLTFAHGRGQTRRQSPTEAEAEEAASDGYVFVKDNYYHSVKNHRVDGERTGMFRRMTMAAKKKLSKK